MQEQDALQAFGVHKWNTGLDRQDQMKLLCLSKNADFERLELDQELKES